MADMRERCRVCDGDGVAYEPYASYDTLVADTCPNCEGHGFVNSKGRAVTDEASARLRCHRCHRTLGVRLADGSWEMLSDSATVVHDGVQRTVCQRCALGVSA